MFALEPIGTKKSRIMSRKKTWSCPLWAISALSQFPLFQMCSCTCLASLEHVGDIYERSESQGWRALSGKFVSSLLNNTFWPLDVSKAQGCHEHMKLPKRSKKDSSVLTWENARGWKNLARWRCLVKWLGPSFADNHRLSRTLMRLVWQPALQRSRVWGRKKDPAGCRQKQRVEDLHNVWNGIGFCSMDYRRWLKNGWYRMMLLLTVPNLRCVYLLKWPKTSAHMAGAAQSVAADGLAWPKSKHESQLIIVRCNEKCHEMSHSFVWFVWQSHDVSVVRWEKAVCPRIWSLTSLWAVATLVRCGMDPQDPMFVGPYLIRRCMHICFLSCLLFFYI